MDYKFSASVAIKQSYVLEGESPALFHHPQGRDSLLPAIAQHLVLPRIGRAPGLAGLPRRNGSVLHEAKWMTGSAEPNA